MNLPEENKRNTQNKRFCLFLFIAVGMVLFGAIPVEAASFPPPPTTVPFSGTGGSIVQFSGSLISGFYESFREFAEYIFPVAQNLFYLLFLCQFAWSIIQLLLSGEMSFSSVFITVTRQILTGMFFYWFLFDRSILDTIVASFAELAGAGRQISFADFLQSFDFMLSTLLSVTAEKSVGAWMTVFTLGGGAIVNGVLWFFAAIVALIYSYTAMSMIGLVIVTSIEQYILASIGLILLGLGGADYTRDYAKRYIYSLVHVGFKLFVLSLFTNISLFVLEGSMVAAMLRDTRLAFMQGLLFVTSQCFLILGILPSILPLISGLMQGISGQGTPQGAFGGMAKPVGAGVGAVQYARSQVKGGIENVKKVASLFSSKKTT